MSYPRPFDRDAILAVLWADPIAAVSGQDIPVRLQRGEEYVDLQRLEAGIQRAAANMSPTGGELSRKAVRSATWEKLVAHLDAPDARR